MYSIMKVAVAKGEDEANAMLAAGWRLMDVAFNRYDGCFIYLLGLPRKSVD
jgi:hypothetical protein